MFKNRIALSVQSDGSILLGDQATDSLQKSTIRIHDASLIVVENEDGTLVVWKTRWSDLANQDEVIDHVRMFAMATKAQQRSKE